MIKPKFWIAIQCCLVLLLLLGAAMVWAEEVTPTPTPTPQVKVTQPPKKVTVTAMDIRLAAAISNAYQINVSGQDISDLRINQKLGYGEIGLLYGLANASGKSLTDILALRQSDKGWGEIAKSLGIKVSNIKVKTSSVLKTAKMPKEDEKLNNELKKEDEKLNNQQKNEAKTKETNAEPTKAPNSNSNSQTKQNSGKGKK